MLRRVMATVMLAAVSATGDAQAASKVQIAQGESVLTLRVDGDLTIDPQGRVTDYQVRTMLEPKLQQLLAKAVPGWRFQPIQQGGKPIVAKSPMRITLAAAEVQGGYEVRVDNVVFRPNTKDEWTTDLALRRQALEQGVAGPSSPADGAPGATQPVLVSAEKLTPPGYPTGLVRAGVEGVVLLNLRLDPDGSVAEVFASQSSLLNVKGRPELLDRARIMLEKNAATTAKNWRFKVEAAQPSRLTASDLTVRVPVEYTLSSPRSGEAWLTGKWRNEFRGPSFPVPWLLGVEDAQVVGVSDLDSGEFLAGSSSFKLADKGVIGAAL